MTHPHPAGGQPPPPRTLDAMLADREEGAQVLLQQALDSVTASGLGQILAADAQIEAVHHLLTALWAAENGRPQRGEHEPVHLADLWSLLLYVNDLGRREPQLAVVVRGDRAEVVHRSQLVDGGER